MDYRYNDGGRAAAGYKGKAGDCAVRAVCIALDKPYRETYRELARLNSLATGMRSVRNGMYKETLDRYLSALGWHWHAAPKFSGRKAKASDMPAGIVIARQAHHFVAVVDGIAQDIFNSSNKMVYGYWAKA